MQLLTSPMPLSPEVIDDRVATVLDAGSNITLNYDDAANVLTISAASGASGAPTNAEYVTSVSDSTLSAERVLTDTPTVSWDRSTPGQIKATAGGVGGYTNEDAQDAVGTILQDSATVDFIYNDATPYITGVVKDNSITESMLSLSDNTTKDATTAAHGLLMKLSGNTVHFLRGDGTWVTPPAGTSYTNEEAQDAVGGILTDSSTIDFTYNDAANTITASVIAGSVAPSDAQYITSASNANLSAERVLTDTATVTWDFSTAGQAKANSAGGGLTTEQIQDLVAAMFPISTTLNFIYDDTAGTIAADIRLSRVTENHIALTDTTFDDATTALHGFLRKLSGNSAQYLDGNGNWTTPPSGTSRGEYFLFMGA